MSAPNVKVLTHLPGWLTSTEAADRLGCTTGYLRQLVTLGLLSCVAVGPGMRSIRIYKEDEIDRYKYHHPNLGKHKGSRTKHSLVARVENLF